MSDKKYSAEWKMQSLSLVSSSSAVVEIANATGNSDLANAAQNVCNLIMHAFCNVGEPDDLDLSIVESLAEEAINLEGALGDAFMLHAQIDRLKADLDKSLANASCNFEQWQCWVQHLAELTDEVTNIFSPFLKKSAVTYDSLNQLSNVTKDPNDFR